MSCSCRERSRAGHREGARRWGAGDTVAAQGCGAAHSPQHQHCGRLDLEGSWRARICVLPCYLKVVILHAVIPAGRSREQKTRLCCCAHWGPACTVTSWWRACAYGHHHMGMTTSTGPSSLQIQKECCSVAYRLLLILTQIS